MGDRQTERFYYIDWLRVIAIGAIFLFHCAMPFNAVQDWDIKDTQSNTGLMIIVAFVHQWSMPLFFFLAGASAWLALQHRTNQEFLIERIKRLIIPLVFGVLLLSPFQVYLENIRRLQFHSSYLQYYFHFFQPPDQVFSNPDKWFNLRLIYYYARHLWFLGFLFLFSWISLPLFRRLQSMHDTVGFYRLIGWFPKKTGIWGFILPIALIQVTLRAGFPEYVNWADFGYWFTFFIYGYLFISRERLMQRMEQTWKPALISGLICFSGIIVLYAMGLAGEWEIHPQYSTAYLAYQVLRSINTWCWVVFFLGAAKSHWNRKNDLLEYSSSAVLPFYILHRFFIVVTGFYILQWRSGTSLKFTAIFIIALAVTLFSYEFMIRRISGLRFLFGMKPIKKLPLPDKNIDWFRN